MTKVKYICEACHRILDEMELEEAGIAALGFDALTPEDREDIIKEDIRGNFLQIASLCEDCIDSMVGTDQGEK